MAVLYHRHYAARYRAVADLIPPLSSVLDVCCGPAVLFDRYLRHKNVDYTGIDVSRPFIERLNARGGRGRVWNVSSEEPLPSADHVIMQASLYQFLPQPERVVGRMLEAARERLIIAEPIRNVTSSRVSVLGAIGRHLSDPGSGKSVYRFTEETLNALFANYREVVTSEFLIPGGREKVFVLDAVRARNGARSCIV